MILNIPSAHNANNPGAYTPDAAHLKWLDRAKAGRYPWVRLNWAFDSAWPTPDKFEGKKLRFLATECIKRGLGMFLVHGSGPWPNQTAWHDLAGMKDWPATAPPQSLYGPIIERCNIMFRSLWDLYAAAGLNPKHYLKLQPHNEMCDGGAGQWPGAKLLPDYKEGRCRPATRDYVEALTWGLNTLGCPMVSPGLEGQSNCWEYEFQESIGPCWRRYDEIDMHCYKDQKLVTVEQKYDRMAAKLELIGGDYIAGTPVIVAETDQQQALIVHGVQGVGLYDIGKVPIITVTPPK